MIQQGVAPSQTCTRQTRPVWLDAMADLVQQGRLDELDYAHLGEYLSDMARSDRQRVESRLTTLLEHLLKWEHQQERRSNSWRRTLVVQRQKLAQTRPKACCEIMRRRFCQTRTRRPRNERLPRPRYWLKPSQRRARTRWSNCWRRGCRGITKGKAP